MSFYRTGISLHLYFSKKFLPLRERVKTDSVILSRIALLRGEGDLSVTAKKLQKKIFGSYHSGMNSFNMNISRISHLVTLGQSVIYKAKPI